MRFVNNRHDILLFKHEFYYFYCHHLCEELIKLNGLMPRAGFLRHHTGARASAITRYLVSAASLYIILFGSIANICTSVSPPSDQHESETKMSTYKLPSQREYTSSYPILARLLNSPRTVWPQKHGLFGCCREVPVTNQRHYHDLTFQYNSCVNIIQA